ncbi:YecA/YgfB family protein [Variovorax sp. PAMC 28711]|uniref:YecA/YgfB family protein n=1 Tax=Variovorax sp. PAMC 28711 TaxID=1795631 RepID=UPI00078D6268|nr:YecA family protein [Variovorax sp. PAMC 28711]AMM25059.1 zinc chelation protein SecC [Variovorax sp. PAMC 28711]
MTTLPDTPAIPPSTTAGTPEPLGPDDFDALDNALDTLREHDDEVPQWEFCEGFMAALVCTRRPIPPAEYWPVLLGEGFVPAQQMEFVWRWKRRWAEIEEGLDADVQSLDDERTWQPEVLDTRGAIASLPEEERTEMVGEAIPSFAQVWALGFMYAVENWPDEWTAPRDKEAADMLNDALDNIVALTEDDTAKPTVSMFSEDGPPSVSQQRLDDFGAAIWAVYDLRQLWKSMGPRQETIRKEPQPGRNDLCPCGSGKKFKKCHGA